MRPDPMEAASPGAPDAPLEGDEGELEQRDCSLGRALRETRIDEVRRRPPTILRQDAPAAKAIAALQRHRAGAVLVVDRRRPPRLVGILTARDVIDRVLPRRGGARLPLARVMTPSPETLRPEHTLVYALNRMSLGRYRHLPLVDARGAPVGLLGLSDVTDFLVELVPEAVQNLPPEPELETHPAVDGG